MIVFNQANTERVEYMLDMLEIRGFTFFEEVQGRGSKNGEPRRGTHAWPEIRGKHVYPNTSQYRSDILYTVDGMLPIPILIIVLML